MKTFLNTYMKIRQFDSNKDVKLHAKTSSTEKGVKKKLTGGGCKQRAKNRQYGQRQQADVARRACARHVSSFLKAGKYLS